MQTTNSNECLKLTLPFIGRKQEAAQLLRLHAQRKHVLILGPAGIGKSALVAHLGEWLGLLLCPQPERLGSICQNLETQLGLESGGARLLQRKQRLLHALAGANRTVVFDGVHRTIPRVSAFLEGVMDRVPVWICTRSDHPWDIGHFWPLLVRFDKMELRPLRPAETRALVGVTIEAGLVPREASNFANWLHHRSNGNPLVLRGLLERLAAHHYDLGGPSGRRRLDLDRRIHELFPSTPFDR